MGAWGAGIFDNDDAMDWWGDLLDAGDPLSSINEAYEEFEDFEPDERDSPECSNALAAAAVVAAYRHDSPIGLPDDGAPIFSKHRISVDELLLSRTKRIVDAITTESELKDLWEESDSYDEWKKAIANLNKHLA